MRFLVLFMGGLSAASANAQTPANTVPQDEVPAIRRWIDVQNVHLTSRFRWIATSGGRVTSSTLQWQPQIRGRVLIDPAARYTVGFNAHSGNQFTSSWNNTGAGLGEFSGDFNLKQLFFAATPVARLSVEIGGLYMARGENTEITTYDNDAYLMGERVVVRPRGGIVSQVSLTGAFIGDYRTPNVFERFDRLDEWNYGQVLLAVRAGPLVALSFDYTRDTGRDFFHEGATIRLPAGTPVLQAIKLEAYQRTSGDTGQGFNVAGDVQPIARLAVTAGVAHVDEHYVTPGYGAPNADRFDRGTRAYWAGTYQLTRELSVGWWQGRAFDIDFPIPIKHRWELIATINPTAWLRERGVF